MNIESECARLKKENDMLKKIIETQQHTISRLVDSFILRGNTAPLDSADEMNMPLE